MNQNNLKWSEETLSRLTDESKKIEERHYDQMVYDEMEKDFGLTKEFKSQVLREHDNYLISVVLKTAQDKKLFQTKIDRKLSEQFKMVCVAVGKTQKELIEECMLLANKLAAKKLSNIVDPSNEFGLLIFLSQQSPSLRGFVDRK